MKLVGRKQGGTEMRAKTMVNTAVVAALFVLFAGVNGAAQTATGSPAKPDEVATLSQAWKQAAMDHDTKTLERLMADDFTLVHPSQDKVTPRAEWLKNLEGFTVTSFKYQHLRVTHYGKSVAIACAILRIDGTLADGKPWPAPKTSVIDVWEKRHGKWQVVTRYATRPGEIMPPPAKVAPKE
jgi:ketosteroid isomerase-like protein